jgi:hypothetical protein
MSYVLDNEKNIYKLEINKIMRLLKFVAEIQYNVTVCTNDDIQLNALIGGFKFIILDNSTS